MYLPLIAVFIAISGSMGVTYMATDSLPGDPLYPVKVRVNEEVKHMVAIRPEAKANVSAEIIARRAQEARKLVAEGRLDAESKARLSDEIQAELKTWNKTTAGWINSGTSSSQIEARTKFESQAKTNADIFQILGVSLQPSSVAEASSSASVFLNASSVELDATSTLEDGSAGPINSNASTSLDARGVINVR